MYLSWMYGCAGCRRSHHAHHTKEPTPNARKQERLLDALSQALSVWVKIPQVFSVLSHSSLPVTVLVIYRPWKSGLTRQRKISIILFAASASRSWHKDFLKFIDIERTHPYCLQIVSQHGQRADMKIWNHLQQGYEKLHCKQTVVDVNRAKAAC